MEKWLILRQRQEMHKLLSDKRKRRKGGREAKGREREGGGNERGKMRLVGPTYTRLNKKAY